jgi:hypothetical protein
MMHRKPWDKPIIKTSQGVNYRKEKNNMQIIIDIDE